MVDKFEAQNNKFVVTRNDRIAFSSDAPSINLFGAQAVVINGLDIDFPNLLSCTFYQQQNQGGGANFTTCDSFSALLPQEHGPGYGNFSPTGPEYLNNRQPPRRELAPSTIGTVPAGTDYVDVRVRLRRTIVPPTFLNVSAPFLFAPENQWINLIGGSCPCEYFVPLIRTFDIVLSGTTLLLHRYQSVESTVAQSITSTGGNTDNVVTTQIGDAYGNYANAPVYWSQRAVLWDSKGPNGTGNKRAPWGTTSSNSCAVNGPPDYTSRYNADFIITPGRRS